MHLRHKSKMDCQDGNCKPSWWWWTSSPKYWRQRRFQPRWMQLQFSRFAAPWPEQLLQQFPITSEMTEMMWVLITPWVKHAIALWSSIIRQVSCIDIARKRQDSNRKWFFKMMAVPRWPQSLTTYHTQQFRDGQLYTVDIVKVEGQYRFFAFGES